ncbi:hypothetical protein [Blastococcus sp. TF02A-30]|uniref:hypothetical protein n=1 Tax=Blastococcus sp. TF02A-30 TaxID=2250580 RepID=UPI000DEA16F6|nr:hypothetical protein [Blastococcus sp. TF02A-30]RBY89393.1 hypothetical protein DQ241_07950 [Blastococcus sp. TF02A-30]
MRVDGRWDIVQSNGFRVAVNVAQRGDQLDVQASHSGGRVFSLHPTAGVVRGTHLDMTIVWSDGSKGQYTGDLRPNKFALPGFHLAGETRDLNHPTSRATWFSEGRDFQPV